MISILILTKDEERNLPGCLRSVAWSNDVIVFDSHSKDRTIELAKAAGARVFQRHFDNYSRQREAARISVDYRHQWVLALDADERVEPALADEMQQRLREDGDRHAAYRLRRKDFFLGRWLRYASLYPTWFLRLYQPAKIQYGNRPVHEYPEAGGTVGNLRHHLLHDSFGKGFDAWLEKHRQYAELEAACGGKVGEHIPWRDLWKRPEQRRRLLKELGSRLPLRPALRFGYMYGLRRGALDGAEGLVYCALLAWYESEIARAAQRGAGLLPSRSIPGEQAAR